LSAHFRSVKFEDCPATSRRGGSTTT